MDGYWIPLHLHDQTLILEPFSKVCPDTIWHSCFPNTDLPMHFVQVYCSFWTHRPLFKHGWPWSPLKIWVSLWETHLEMTFFIALLMTFWGHAFNFSAGVSWSCSTLQPQHLSGWAPSSPAKHVGMPENRSSKIPWNMTNKTISFGLPKTNRNFPHENCNMIGGLAPEISIKYIPETISIKWLVSSYFRHSLLYPHSHWLTPRYTISLLVLNHVHVNPFLLVKSTALPRHENRLLRSRFPRHKKGQNQNGPGTFDAVQLGVG